MSENKTIVPASNTVRKMWEKHGIKEPMRFLGFCLSMLPIPVIQQAGLALDRHLGDKAFEEQLSELWDEIKSTNELVSRVKTIEESIQEIAKTLQANPELEKKAENFISSLSTSQNEFSVLTENHSYQELINTIIHADISAFVAKDGSTNVIKNSTVNSETTHLHTTDNSKTFVDGTTFQGENGAVSMQGITTQGPISVQGSGIGFGEGGSIIFGGNPNEISGNCPNCNELLRVDKREVVKHKQIQCPKCNLNMSYTLQSS